MLLVTLSKYKEAIGETSSANDGRHTEAIEDASAAVLSFTDRDFGAAEVTEDRTFAVPDAGNIIDIDDCTEITAVSGLGTNQWRAGGEGPVAAAGVYTYIEYAPRSDSALMGFRTNEDVLGSYPLAEVTVSATWGWPTVPDDVQRAVIWIAAAFEGDQSNLQGGLAAKSVAEVAENYIQQQTQQNQTASDNEPLPARARALLLPYRRMSL